MKIKINGITLNLETLSTPIFLCFKYKPMIKNGIWKEYITCNKAEELLPFHPIIDSKKCPKTTKNIKTPFIESIFCSYTLKILCIFNVYSSKYKTMHYALANNISSLFYVTITTNERYFYFTCLINKMTYRRCYPLECI